MVKARFKTMTAAGLALSLFAAPAMAQDAFDDWNTDAEAGINSEEFNTGFGEVGAFDNWDSDSSGALSENEFSEGLFGSLDTDNSGSLEEAEFNSFSDGADRWGFDSAEMSEWDTNADSAVSQDEFDTQIGDNNTYAGWDSDESGDVSETEFHESTFGVYDDDENNVIEEPEFGDLGDDIGDGGFWDV